MDLNLNLKLFLMKMIIVLIAISFTHSLYDNSLDSSACNLSSDSTTVKILPNGTAKILKSRITVQATTAITSNSMTLQSTAVVATKTTCEIIRKYLCGARTLEVFSVSETDDKTENGLAWTFSTTSECYTKTIKPRIPINIVTTIDVKEWNKSNMSWWMALTTPSDNPTSERTSPFEPTSSVTNNSDPNGSGLLYNYGGFKFRLNESDGLPILSDGSIAAAGFNNGYVIPLLSFLKSNDVGLSFYESQKSLTTYADIRINLIQPNNVARFTWSRRLLGLRSNTKYLDGRYFTHEDCWRPALGAYWKHHNPLPLGDISLTEGAATYAYYFDQPGLQSSSYYKSMDLTMNWDASFPWVYHGPWVPFNNDRQYFPTSAETITKTSKTTKSSHMTDANFNWLNCDPAGHGGHAINKLHPDWPKCMIQNYTLLNAWYRHLKKKLSVNTLMYGTLEEFGIGINTSYVKNQDISECDSQNNYTKQLICGANRLFLDHFSTSPLINPRKNTTVQAAWESIIVDFWHGEMQNGYSQFLLNNTKRLIKYFNATIAGICFDRGDYIGLLNVNGDDGVSTTPNGRISRALVFSWKLLLSSIHQILHQNNKLIYVNPDMGHRVDMYSFVDGFYSELGDTPPGKWRTGTAWLASGGKHAAIWCHAHGDPETNCASLMTNGTNAQRDRFLQSHLLLGLYPTVTFPDNDHEILPHIRADQIYQEYGPLFTLMHGKRWYTGAHPVRIESNNNSAFHGSVNIFEMKPFNSGCYVIPVVWSNVTVVNIVLGILAKGQSGSVCQIMHLSGRVLDCIVDNSTSKNNNGSSMGIIRNVTIVRGCAMVKVCI